MALELGTYPKSTQIAGALVYVYGYPHCPPVYGSFGSSGENYILRLANQSQCLPEGNMSKEAW